jgi:hypothetical protein
MYYAAPLTSFWFLGSKIPPAEFCRIDLGGKKRGAAATIS